MKIVYVITQGSWGGAQAHVYDLLREQVRQQNDVWLVTGTTGRLTEQVKSELPSIHQILLTDLWREISLVHDIRAVIKLRRLLKSINPQLVHLHSAKAGTVGRLAAIKRVPTVYTVHGWAFTTGVSKKRALLATMIERLLQPLTTRYICVSEFDYQLGSQRKLMNDRHPGLVIHNGVSIDPAMTNHSSKAKQPFTIMMAARFDVPKNQALLIRAFAKLKAVYDCQLVLLGDGPQLAACQSLVTELGLESAVIFRGNVKSVTEHYQQADVVTLITNYEGLPISLIEGLALGKPLIASNVGGIPELCQANGLLVSNNEEDIYQALKDLLEDTAQRLQKGQLSKQMYREQFTEQQMLSQLNDIYQSIGS